MSKIKIDSFLVDSMRDYIQQLDEGKVFKKLYPDEIVNAYREHLKNLTEFENWKTGNIPKSPEALRKFKSDQELKNKGGRIIKARLQAKEAKIMDSLEKEFGSVTNAIKFLINNHEQRSLL